jgi:hypothetical protein
LLVYGVSGTDGFFKELLYGGGKGNTQGRVMILRQPTEFSEARKDIQFGVNLFLVPSLLDVGGIEDDHGCCCVDRCDGGPNAIHELEWDGAFRVEM